MVNGNEVRDCVLAQEWDQLGSLLEDGGNPNAIDDRGLSPLHYCISSKIPDATKGIEILLEFGANINQGDLVDQTPLHMAAGEGLLELAEFLIARGADVKASDAWGRTPLHVASGIGQFEIVKNLLSYNANPLAETLSGDRASKIAGDQGHNQISKFLGLLIGNENYTLRR